VGQPLVGMLAAAALGAQSSFSMSASRVPAVLASTSLPKLGLPSAVGGAARADSVASGSADRDWSRAALGSAAWGTGLGFALAAVEGRRA
jgi:hypothetical protein